MKTLIQIGGIVLVIGGMYFIGLVVGDAADDPGGITLSAVLRGLLGLGVAVAGIAAFWLSRKKT